MNISQKFICDLCLMKVSIEHNSILDFKSYKFRCLDPTCKGNLIEIKETNQEIQESTVTRYIPKTSRYEVLKKQVWRCNFCGCSLKYNENSKWEGKVAHVDHIFPFTKRKDYINGEDNINELSNLQALCPDCNLSKSKKNIN